MKQKFIVLLRIIGSLLVGSLFSCLIWLIWHFSVPYVINWWCIIMIFLSTIIFAPIGWLSSLSGGLSSYLIKGNIFSLILYCIPFLVSAYCNIVYDLVPAVSALPNLSLLKWINIIIIGWNMIYLYFCSILVSVKICLESRAS